MNQPRMNRAEVPPLPIVEDTATLYRVTIKPAGTVCRAVVRDSRAFGSLSGANQYASREIEQGLGVQMMRQDGLWWVVVMAVESR